MTAELSDLQLTLTQTQDQRMLRVVKVAYGYTLRNSANSGVKDPGTPFLGEIDILGDDVFTDDLLAQSVDAHSTTCEPDRECRVERSLIVAQAVLDEDVGDDEIKLRVRVSRDKEVSVDAITPIVKGKF